MAVLKANRRILLPFVLAALCLVATTWTGPTATVILLIAALCLSIEGGTKWFSRTGGMSGHRQ